VDIFMPKRPRNTVRLEAIKQQVADSLRLPEDAMVMVTELTCEDEDCPDVETVIAVLRQGQPKLQAKANSVIDSLSYADVQALCEKLARDEQ
jgi:hypothetical protein